MEGRSNFLSSRPASKPRSKSPFDPTVPPFTPSGSAYTYSPSIPNMPQNSLFSNTSYTSPLIHQSRNPSPLSFQSAPGYPAPPRTTPPSMQTHSSAPHPLQRNTESPTISVSSPQGGSEMARTGSGGVRVGDFVIAFGDFPDPVVVSEARQRTERDRAALKTSTSNDVGLGIKEGER